MTDEPTLFDIVDGQHGTRYETNRSEHEANIAAAAHAKNIALARVLANADEDWKKAALLVVSEIATEYAEFTTDLVWQRLERYPEFTHEPRALGAIMNKAAKLGWIQNTGRVSPSTRKENHRRPQTIWTSLISREVSA